MGVVSARIPLYPDRLAERRAGALFYRGGLILNSSDARFGGWSGVAVDDEGKEILAISDQAHWLRARLVYDSNGDLAGLEDGEIAPMLDQNGQEMSARDGDAEGLTLERANDLHGAAIVGFERNTRIWRYDLSRGLDARPTDVPVGTWVNSLANNSQLEAIALLRPDTLIAFGETRVNDQGDIPAAFEAYPGDPMRLATRMASLVPRDPFAVTDAAAAPDGGLFVLERRFSLAGGVGMELRRIPASEICEAARLQGTVIAELSYQDANIDNMEGIALRQGTNGETFLYLISDNNYSGLQRTLLLMFELRE